MLSILLTLIQTNLDPPQYPYLAAEINEMGRVDQAARQFFLKDSGDKPYSASDLKTLGDVDRHNTERMKWIVSKFGCPTPKMVGAEGSGNAWLMVQHADADHPFQKLCLTLIEPLAKARVIQGSYYAYLYDRVQVGDGKVQRFGTQGNAENGLAWIDPVENPAKVDEYRKLYGLGSLEEYAKQLADVYHNKLAPDWRKRLIAKKKK